MSNFEFRTGSNLFVRSTATYTQLAMKFKNSAKPAPNDNKYKDVAVCGWERLWVSTYFSTNCQLLARWPLIFFCTGSNLDRDSVSQKLLFLNGCCRCMYRKQRLLIRTLCTTKLKGSGGVKSKDGNWMNVAACAGVRGCGEKWGVDPV
ncbi:unnamed protein product [Ectocarpus sp. 4 AP-2014]